MVTAGAREQQERPQTPSLRSLTGFSLGRLAVLACLVLLFSAPATASEHTLSKTISNRGLNVGVEELLEFVSTERTRAELDRELARQLKTHRKLAETSSRTLVPVAVVLDRAYGELREAEQDAAAFQVRALLTQLLELHESAADTFEEQGVAADLYVVLAASFFQQQRDLLAIKYLQQALKLNPANASALLELSKAQELRGKHREALALLDELDAMGLAGPEATLRRALRASRFGREDEAVAELSRLAQSEGPRWIRLIAYQEQVRIEIERERFEAASEALTRALRDFPRDCTLLVAARGGRRRPRRGLRGGDRAAQRPARLFQTGRWRPQRRRRAGQRASRPELDSAGRQGLVPRQELLGPRPLSPDGGVGGRRSG